MVTLAGQPLPLLKTRSYNMSQSVNGVAYPVVLTNLPTYQKLTQVTKPSTAELFVFIDVHEGGILDSLFGIRIFHKRRCMMRLQPRVDDERPFAAPVSSLTFTLIKLTIGATPI